jgi:general secretion pathway protein D
VFFLCSGCAESDDYPGGADLAAHSHTVRLPTITLSCDGQMTRNKRRKARNALLVLLAAQVGAGPLVPGLMGPHARLLAQEIGVASNWSPPSSSLPDYTGGQLQFGHAQSDAVSQLHSSTAVVNTLELPIAFLPSVSTALELRYRDTPGVQVSPDVRGSRLVILAPQSMQRQIQSEAMQIYAAESQPGGLTGTTRSTGGTTGSRADASMKVRLASISWREFEDSLQRVVGKRLPVTTSQNGERASFQLTGAPLDGTTVEVDRRENMVTVIAPEPAMPGWRKMIGSLDQSVDRPGDVVEMIRVENARPAPIQRAIRLLDNLPADQAATIVPTRAGADSFRSAAYQPPAGQPPVGQQPFGQQPFGQPPVGQPPFGQPPVGQPPGQQPEQPGDVAGGIIGDTQIQFVPELGIIIVRGPRRDAQRVLEVIRQIEAQSALTQPEVEVYPLRHLNSAAAAALLTQLYTDVLAARQGEVLITPLDQPNALLLIGRREALANALAVVEKLDQPLDTTSRLQVFRLTHTSAVDAEQTIRNFFVDRPGVGDDVRPGLGTRVRILADYRTNSLIVGASPRDLVEVSTLLRQLDVEKAPAQNEIKVFPLRNSLAVDLAPVLQTAINGEGEAPPADNITRPSTSLSILSLDPRTGGVLDSGILAGVVVAADANANAIIVRGPSTSMALIGELIRQLDQVPGVESLVKVFTIENGDATQLSNALQQLFAQATNQGVGQANLAGLAPATAATVSSLVNLRFSVDTRTNSIIASGSASDLEVVESILLRLDTTGFAERITEVIWLRHQSAPEIATAIQAYVAARAQSPTRIQQYQQGLGPFDLVDRDLIVVAEPISNSLLLSVSPRLYQDVRRLIESLDRRPPMVLIKVVLAEVELRDVFELGGELGLQDSLLFDRGRALNPPGLAGVPGFNFNNAGTPNVSAVAPGDIGSRAVSTFGLGTSSAAAGYGGFVLSAASESFNLLLRALQDAGRAQILSRPQIMTVDNKEGLVQVGQQVARISGLSQQGIGLAPILQVTDINIGLILNVLPRVGADGLISMQIRAERSSIDDPNAGTPIGTDAAGNIIRIPDINTTNAESTITAYSGQTVVFGGLIQKERFNQSRRIPYLADIPLIGVMFRFDRESEVRRELLIIMTPMLITGDEDLEYVKQTESSRMSYCLADVVEMHGDVGLSGGYGLWGPAVGPTIYPDLHPTVDQFPQLMDGAAYGETIYGQPTILDCPVPTTPLPIDTQAPAEMLTPPLPGYVPQQPTPLSAPNPNYSVPVDLDQARRATHARPQVVAAPAGMSTRAGLTMPAGENSPERFVRPADFQFIDGDAAAALSGIAK